MDWVVSILCFVVLSTLGHIATIEQSITVGGRFGLHHADGISAVVTGVILFVGVFYILAKPFERIFEKTILYSGMTMVCLSVIAGYLFLNL